MTRCHAAFAAVAILTAVLTAQATAGALSSDQAHVLQSISLVKLPGGVFFMGVKDGEEHEQQDYPGVLVHVQPFSIASTDVTFEQYDAFARACGHALPQDEGFGRGSRPVINLNRREMLDFIAWLNAGSGRHFRLPGEAEWEYAARGGTTSAYFWGDDPSSDYANLADTHGRDQFLTTSPVGAFKANPFGLYDMSGNVWQAVADCTHPTLVGLPKDGRPWTDTRCFTHIARGGWYNSGPRGSRVTARAAVAATFRSMGLGFRLAENSNAH